jgi:hypothetical protein
MNDYQFYAIYKEMQKQTELLARDRMKARNNRRKRSRRKAEGGK